jgi:hypothetical protein
MVGMSFAFFFFNIFYGAGVKNMERSTKSHRLLGPLSSKSAPIITTLYELVETVNEEIKPGEEHWVSLIVDHILTAKAAKSDKKENIYMEV